MCYNTQYELYDLRLRIPRLHPYRVDLNFSLATVTGCREPLWEILPMTRS